MLHWRKKNRSKDTTAWAKQTDLKIKRTKRSIREKEKREERKPYFISGEKLKLSFCFKINLFTQKCITCIFPCILISVFMYCLVIIKSCWFVYWHLLFITVSCRSEFMYLTLWRICSHLLDSKLFFFIFREMLRTRH